MATWTAHEFLFVFQLKEHRGQPGQGSTFTFTLPLKSS